MPKYLVETVSMFRHRFVIDCESMDHAKDVVVMNEAEELSQKHIDENVFSCREITDEEIPVLFFEDHPYLVDRFDDDHVLKNYVHKVEYDGQG